MSEWTVRVTIPGLAIYTGTRSLVIDPDADPVLPQLTSVQWSHELETDDDAWPRREAITTATLTILMETAAQAATIGPQSLVYCELLTELGGDTVDSFSGRASYPSIVPHELGVLVTITVTDYLIDLAAYMVGGADLPAELAADRINDMMGGSLIVPETPWAVMQAARPANAVTLLDFMRELVGGTMAELVVLHVGIQYAAYELRARLDGGYLHPTNPWTLVRLDKRLFPDVPPLLLRENPDAPGTYEAYADPGDTDTAPAVIDGTCTTFDAQWAKRLNGPETINTVHVKLANGHHVSVTNANVSEALVAYTRETQLDSGETTNATALAEFLLPDANDEPTSSWQAESFTVLLNETPDGWYPMPLRSIMALSDIQRRHHPEAKTYLAGVVTKLELSVAAGVATATVRLEGMPIYGGDVAAGGITIDQLPGTIDQLDVTMNELELVHGP